MTDRRPAGRRRFPSRAAWAVTVAAVAATLAYGQDDARPDQLRKRYADVLGQLKQAQDRKGQLAADDDRLTARNADLQKQLDAATARVADLSRQVDAFGDRTLFLRSHYAAWRAFVAADPPLRRRWDAYLKGDGPASLAAGANPVDLDWPFAPEP